MLENTEVQPVEDVTVVEETTVEAVPELQIIAESDVGMLEDVVDVAEDTEVVGEVEGAVEDLTTLCDPSDPTIADMAFDEELAEVEPESVADVMSAGLPDPQEEVVAPAAFNANVENPMIVCTATDPDGCLIVGGVTQDGRGFLMKKYNEAKECPTLAIGGGICAVKTIFIDVTDAGYDIICGCLNVEGYICIMRCDSDLNIKKIVQVDQHEAHITSFTKWGNEFLVAAVRVVGDKQIVTAIVRLDDELMVTGATDLNLDTPEGYESSDPNAPTVGMITQMTPASDVLVIGGSSRNPGTSYGFLALIDKDFKPIKGLILTMGDMKYTSVESVTIRHGVISVMCICTLSTQPNPASVIKDYNMDLEPVKVTEEITVSETETTITEGDDVVKVIEVKETEVVTIEDADKGYN